MSDEATTDPEDDPDVRKRLSALLGASQITAELDRRLDVFEQVHPQIPKGDLMSIVRAAYAAGWRSCLYVNRNGERAEPPAGFDE